MEKENEINKVNFNAGISKLERINKIWIQFHDNYAYSNYPVCCSSLKQLRLSFHSKMNKTERETADVFEREIKSFISISPQQLEKLQEHQRYNYNIYQIDKYAMWLSDIENKYGLSLNDSKNDEELFL